MAALCDGCGASFPSRNAVFRHLKDTDGACLSKDEYKDFVRYVRKSVKPPKVVLLYGYLPYDGCSNAKDTGNDSLKRTTTTIRDGEDAGNIILQKIHELQNEIDGFDDEGDGDDSNNVERESPNSSYSSNKINRSYGFHSRSSECTSQDTNTAAITEVMTARLFPLRGDMSMDDWLDRVQKKTGRGFRPKDARSRDGRR
mmetsp:Transcript_28676/g.61762  ORF Transcript_28676/g.61762 Transcript_28676/m.61762 type:complete len:199 (+) Transcript_28676:143-739(+)